jgi:putative hemolysin
VITDILIVLVLIVINGLLALCEMAIVSARPARLKAMAAAGQSGARIAIALAEDPGRFLSTVQIGITAVGVLSWAVSGATLGVRLADALQAAGVAPGLADTLGVGGVVLLITFVSLVMGELVPKQLALRHPESLAAAVAPAMRLLSTICAPLVWLLDRSGRLILWLLGQSGETSDKVTEEEVQHLLTEARDSGVIETDERELLSGVMRLADRSARGLLTPRREVAVVSRDIDPGALLARLAEIGRDRVPVQGSSPDEMLGVVQLADVVRTLAKGERLDLGELMRPVPAVLDSTDALDLFGVLRRCASRMVFVFDEYGGFEGIVTPGNILEAITGSLAADGAAPGEAIVTRADGSLLIPGGMPSDEFCDRLGLPRGVMGDYTTAAGVLLNQLHRMAHVGDQVTLGDWTVEVVDMDGRRIDKILASPIPGDATAKD